MLEIEVRGGWGGWEWGGTGGGFCCERAAAHVYSMLLELKTDQYVIIP